MCFRTSTPIVPSSLAGVKRLSGLVASRPFQALLLISCLSVIGCNESRHSNAQQGEESKTSSETEYTIGHNFSMGTGGPRDFGQAATHLRRAASQGYSHAQYEIGMLIINKHVVPIYQNEAFQWIEK